MKTLAVIPARGDSKGIPLKNIYPILGKPLIGYTIESAQKVKGIDHLVVSTDHDKIAAVAEEFGAQVIRRPAELATDTASTESALLHALDEMKNRHDFEAEIVLTLEPTSPLRSAETIASCLTLFDNTDADSALGVIETRACYGRIIEGRYEFLFPGQPRRRQEREPLFKESSTIYATRAETLRRKNSVLGDKLYPVIVPEMEAYDINTPLDIKIVEKLMHELQAEGRL